MPVQRDTENSPSYFELITANPPCVRELTPMPSPVAQLCVWDSKGTPKCQVHDLSAARSATTKRKGVRPHLDRSPLFE